MKRRNRRVYLEFQIGNKKAGQVVIDLFYEIVPKAAENFEELCTGNRGIGRETGQPLCYAGCKVTKIIPGQFLQCGDFEFNNGSGGESVYGGPFEDENFNLWHGCAGIVSMHNTGVDTNRSQFYITFKAMPTLNRRNVIVGQVRKGMEIVRAIEKLPTRDQYIPRVPVFISGSGIFEYAKSVDASQLDESSAVTEGVAATAAEKGLKLLQSLMTNDGGDQELYNSENIAAADGSAARRKSSATRARELFDATQGCCSAKHVQRMQALTEKKTSAKGVEYSVWNEASVFNRYDRTVDKMQRTGLAPRLTAKPKRNRQTNRSAKTNEDVTYINYRNKLFNKKLEKAYGSFVVDIRQNLERGTAI